MDIRRAVIGCKYLRFLFWAINHESDAQQPGVSRGDKVMHCIVCCSLTHEAFIKSGKTGKRKREGAQLK